MTDHTAEITIDCGNPVLLIGVNGDFAMEYDTGDPATNWPSGWIADLVRVRLSDTVTLDRAAMVSIYGETEIREIEERVAAKYRPYRTEAA